MEISFIYIVDFLFNEERNNKKYSKIVLKRKKEINFICN